MSSFTARLFGPFEVWIDGAPMPRLRSRKGQLLLAHLILRHGQEVTRDWLCGVLWPESFVEQARLSLRQSLVDLRKALGSEANRIEALGATGLRFDAAGADIDVVKFDAEGDMGVYRGPLLEGIRDDAIQAERDARAEAFVRLARTKAEADVRRGDRDEAVRCLRRAIFVNPLDESSHRLLMQMLAEGGHVAEGMEVYRRLRAHLRDEFLAEPDAQTVAVYEGLRSRVREEHRGRAGDVGSSARPLKLPRPLTPLIGRDYEAASTVGLLESHRFVSLTGLGGIGKTRLSLEVARLIGEANAATEVAFVTLAPYQPSQPIDEYLRAVLEVPETRPLLDWMGDVPRLLVLDNCEPVLDEVADFLLQAFDACPELRVLATSRTSVGIPGEVVVALRPLTFAGEGATLEETEAAPACALMLDRMGRTLATVNRERDVRFAGEICRRLDGIPLAIELAAAQSRALPLGELLARIDRPFELLRSAERGRPARHLTMEATIQGSYELLDEETRRCFRTLGIFVGGFRLEAAERVCATDGTLGAIARLVDASLLTIAEGDDTGPRYVMLETIRAYALARLREAGEEEAVRQRHFDECLRFASVARAELMGPDQVLWCARLDTERGNFRFALEHCVENQAFFDLLNSLFFYWHLKSHTQEASRWFAEAMGRTEGVRTASVARMYSGAATMAWHRMEMDDAYRWVNRAVELGREGGDTDTLFSALNVQGIVLRMIGEYERAFESSAESVRLIRQANHPARLARGLANLGRAATTLQRYADAEAYFQESLALFGQAGDEREGAHTLQSYAWCLGHAGRIEESRRHHLEAVATLERLKDDYRLAWSFVSIATLCIIVGQWEDAARLYGTIQSLERTHGFEILNEKNTIDQAQIARVGEAIGEDRYRKLLEETYGWTVEQGIGLVRAVCAPQG
ncbi:MAG: BTAD domain-containing putative transcriptional regulator [Fimbriimonas sp.]